MQKRRTFKFLSSCCDLVILVDFCTYSLLISALTNTAIKTSRGKNSRLLCKVVFANHCLLGHKYFSYGAGEGHRYC